MHSLPTSTFTFGEAAPHLFQIDIHAARVAHLELAGLIKRLLGGLRVDDGKIEGIGAAQKAEGRGRGKGGEDEDDWQGKGGSGVEGGEKCSIEKGWSGEGSAAVGERLATCQGRLGGE